MGNLLILREAVQIVKAEEMRLEGWYRRIAEITQGLDILCETDISTNWEKQDILREIVIKSLQLLELAKQDKVP